MDFVINFLESINYIRIGGSENERRASEIIYDKFKELGGTPSFSEFNVKTFSPSIAKITVLEPYKKVYEGYCIGYTGNHDFEAELVCETSDTESLSDVDNKIIMVIERVNFKNYEKLIAQNVKGFLMVNPPDRKTQCPTASIEAVDKFGQICGISIPFTAGYEMINRKA